MLALGFSSGLPLYLTGSTLAAWMTNEGVSLKTIGIFSLVGTSYTFKFAWAPLMDRYFPPFLGRRRGWLVVTQVLLAGGLVAMGQVNPRTDAVVMAALAALVAFLSASQDIVADAYRTDLLTEAERPLGVTTFTLGYRLGMIFAMAIALTLSDIVGWKYSYVVMGSLMSVGIIATLLAREPEVTQRPRSLVTAVVYPFLDFFGRYQRALPATVNPVLGFFKRYQVPILILLFIVLFRVGDAIAFRMTTPFVLKLGFTNTQLGVIQKGVGMGAAITGAVVGGLLVVKLGLRWSLLLFGSAQALTNLFYIGLHARGVDPYFLALTVGADNFAGGMGSAAITVFLTALCNKKFSATQYALLSSLGAVPMQLLGVFSGFLAESLSWPTFFAFTTFAMAPALLVLLLIPREAGLAPQPEAETEQLTRPSLAPEATAELAASAKKGTG
ncbi:MAG TPA: AmpG family muropeptide MFS transporter [Hyalangium sp.]|nr:AmpG family muropeptide MFS transporter [Hyalangium sp.]HYH96528.1 AmpG family muropeptide MFS transporter [Hyalangium sp.]